MPSRKRTRKVIATREFSNHVDITDPCYSKTAIHRLNNIEIESGKYECNIWIKREHYVSRIGIYLNGEIPNVKDMVPIGYISVDAGLAGFFNSPKPDYALLSDTEWEEFCNNIDDENRATNIDDGFFSSSGYGDGRYTVFGYKKTENGPYTALEIIFI